MERETPVAKPREAAPRGTERDMRVLLIAPRYPYPTTRGGPAPGAELREGPEGAVHGQAAHVRERSPVPVERVTTISVRRGSVPGAVENVLNADPRLPFQVRRFPAPLRTC
jgi:hypothetical protein